MSCLDISTKTVRKHLDADNISYGKKRIAEKELENEYLVAKKQKT